MSGLKSGQVLSSNNQSRLQKGYNFTTGKIEKVDYEEPKAARLEQQRQSVVFKNNPINRAKNEYDKIGNEIADNLISLGSQKKYEDYIKNVEPKQINLAGDTSLSKQEKQQMREETKEKIKNLPIAEMRSADEVQNVGDDYLKEISNKTGYTVEEVTKYLTDYNKGKWDSTKADYYLAAKKFESAGYPVYEAVKELNKYSSKLGKPEAGNFEKGVATATDFILNIGEGALSTFEGITDASEYLLANQIENWGKMLDTPEVSKYSTQIRDYATMNATKAIFGENEKEEENFKKDWAKTVRDSSLLDDNGRNVAQGIGNTMGFAALAYLGTAAGIPSNITTNTSVFTSSYGNTKSNLLASGYDNETATKGAIISALSETISENIFDFKFGMDTSGWADKLVEGITDSMDDVPGQIFQKLFESTSEGSEEVVSNVLNAVFTDIVHYIDSSYDYNVDTGNIPQDVLNQLMSEDTWKEFISASISTALVNSAATVITQEQKKEVIRSYADTHGMSFDEAKDILQLNEDKIYSKLTKDNALNSAKQLVDMGYSQTQAMRSVNDMLEQKGLPSIQVIQKTNNEAENMVDFYGNQMTQKDILRKINDIQTMLKKGNITDTGSIERLVDATHNLQYALNELEIENQKTPKIQEESVQPETKETPKQEIKVEDKQSEKVIKDTQQEQEQLRNTIQENEAKLEELRSNKVQNEQQIRKLEEKLTNLRDEKASEVDSKKLERSILAQRRAVDDLQQRYESEQKLYGITPDTLKIGQELSKAKTRLQQLLEEQKGNKTKSDKTINDKINKIKKQIEELNDKGKADEIKDLEKQIKTDKKALEDIEDEELSKDEIAADIEYDDSNLEEAPLEIEEENYTDVLKEMPEQDKKLKEKVKETFDATGNNISKIMTNFVTSYYPFEQLYRVSGNENLLPALQSMSSADTEAQSDISGVQRDLEGNIVGKSLNEIFKPIEKENHTYVFGLYMYLSRQATKAEGTADVFGDDITSEDAKELIKDMEQDFPQFKDWKKDVLNYEKNLRNMMVDSGLLSQKASDYLEELYPEYVRIYRDVYKNNAEVVREGGRIRVVSPIKTAKGGTQNLIPLKEALAKQTLEVKKSARANMFGQELYNILGGANTKYKSSNINNNLMEFKDNKYGYVFYKNGKQKTVSINETMKNALDNSRMLKEGVFTKVTGGLGKVQRSLITNLNPFFAITNMPKDYFDALINTKNPGGFLINYPKAWAFMISNNELWKTYKAMGGTNVSVFDYNKGFNEESTLKKVLKSPLKVMEFIGEHSEQVTRFAEFLNTLSHGGTMAQAMYNAAEVTVNFKKGGKYTKQFGRYGFNYVNASVLGAYKAFENIANRKGGKAFIKYAVRLGILSILPAIANSMLYGDDDDYEALSDDVKYKNYVFKIGKHDFLKIPKGRLNSIISNIPQKLVEGKDITPSSYLGFTLDQIGPSNPIESNIYYPLLNVVTNSNNATNYFGSNIIPTRYKTKTLEEQRKDPKLTAFAKKMSEITGMSPFLIDYLYDSYSGFIGDVTMPLMTEQADKNAFEAKFIVDSITNNQYVTDLYDLEEKYAYPKTDDDLIRYKYISSKSTGASNYYSQIRSVQRDEKLSDSEKKKKIEKIRTELNAYAKEAVETVKNEKIKTKTVNGEKYKQLGLDYVVKYNKEESKWEKQRNK